MILHGWKAAPWVAAFDCGRITSEAGALLLGATGQVIGLTRRLAACFTDARNPDLIEHDVDTLVTQRVVGIALGYEDLSDHDELRHDSVMAVVDRDSGRWRGRLGQCEQRHQQIARIERGGRDEGQSDPLRAEHPAKHRADDEARAEHGADQTEPAGALLAGRDVGQVGRGDRHVGAGSRHRRPACR